MKVGVGEPQTEKSNLKVFSGFSSVIFNGVSKKQEYFNEGVKNMRRKSKKKLPFYVVANSKGRTVKKPDPAKVKITDSPKSCPKMNLSMDLMGAMKMPHSIQVGFTDDAMVLAETLQRANGVENYFVLRRQSRDYVTYSTPLVREINERFGLVYGDKITLKFQDVEYFNEGRTVVAYIPMKPIKE